MDSISGDGGATVANKGFIAAIRPYVEPAPLAALFLGISSGFPFAMIGATLTTRLAQDGIDKKAVTAFTLAFLVYNLKFLWAWVVDGVRLPFLGRLGQRVSWMLVIGLLVMAAVFHLALVDPKASLMQTAVAAILVGAAGAGTVAQGQHEAAGRRCVVVVVAAAPGVGVDHALRRHRQVPHVAEIVGPDAGAETRRQAEAAVVAAAGTGRGTLMVCRSARGQGPGGS